MTRDDILRMAREANIIDFRDDDSDPHVRQMVDMLAHVVAQAAAAEREACAQACAELSKDYWMGDCQFEAATRCAAAIRARGGQ